MYIIILCLVILIDQISKYLVRQILVVGESIPIINHVFHLSLVFNTGAAFGMFKNQSLFFVLAAVVAIIAIFATLRLNTTKSRYYNLEQFSLVLILAGAIGNLIDRLMFGYVIDFLDFRIWPVFNIADSSITIGACLFVFSVFKKSKKG